MDAQSTINASANIVDGKILFGTDGAEVYCVSTADGKVLWTAKTGDRVNATPSVGGGMTFVSGCDAMLRGVDLQTGQEKFAAELTALAPDRQGLKDRVIISATRAASSASAPTARRSTGPTRASRNSRWCMRRRRCPLATAWSSSAPATAGCTPSI